MQPRNNEWWEAVNAITPLSDRFGYFDTEHDTPPKKTIHDLLSFKPRKEN